LTRLYRPGLFFGVAFAAIEVRGGAFLQANEEGSASMARIITKES
jgi:hypothetical protein